MGKRDFKKRRKGVIINYHWLRGSGVKQIQMENIGERRIKMNTEKDVKKEQKKEVKKPTKKEKHLRPMGPAVIPEDVMERQTKEIQELLKQLNALKERTSPDGAKIRKALRKAGFKLSNYRK